MAVVSLIVMIFGYVRTKYAAVLLNATGVGLVATYSTLLVFFTSVASLGITSSAVREISKAHGIQDELTISRLILLVRRICFFSGLFFMIIFILISPYLGNYFFVNQLETYEVLIIGATLFLSNISSGEMSILQGLMRIKDIARVNIINAFMLLVFSIFFIGYLGEKGILLALFFSSVTTLLVSMWFAHKVVYTKVVISCSEFLNEGIALLKFGLVFLWNGFVSNGVGLVITLLITSYNDIQSVGIYSAAFALSSLLINFILGAMATDYYPRLSGVSNDLVEVNRMVNQQIEISLILSLPGLLTLIVFAPNIIEIFYSNEFGLSIISLRWFVLGCLVKVFIWPIGFVMLALRKRFWSITLETGFNLLFVILSIFGLQYYGVQGIALSFLISYVVYAFITFNIAKRLTSFSLNKQVKEIFFISILALSCAFIIVKTIPVFLATTLGIILLISVCIYCYHKLTNSLGIGLLFHKRK
jgi:PST family polysaccharide transporter